jgi:hypothetical protein
MNLVQTEAKIRPHRKEWTRSASNFIAGRGWQLFAISICFLLGLAMIVNTQGAGESTWYWYTVFFHQGSKLYSDLHLALQPLYILELDAWMNLFGRKLLVTETPSLFHLVFMCVGIFLLLRESDWPDWQKGIVLASSFVLWTSGSSYRFDDYHVTTESFIVYSLVLLLRLAKADTTRRQLFLAVWMGILCGLSTMSRPNDGVALLVSESVCLLVLSRRRKVLVLFVFVCVAALSAVSILKLTGDSFSVYFSSTFTRAVGSKGGAHSFLADPILLFRNSFEVHIERRWILPWFAVLVGAAVLAQRYWKNSVKAIVAVQLVIAAVAFGSTTRIRQEELLTGTLVQFLILAMIVGSYFLAIAFATRYALWKMKYGGVEWGAREILILIPLAELASISVSAAGLPLSGYYSSLAMLLLLAPVIQPYRKRVNWANATFVTTLLLLGFTGVIAKVYTPYYWNTEEAHPMFVNRVWYQHPVYGPMYIDRNLLHLSQSICREIQVGDSKPELLTLPFSYTNYFCDVPPWHGYVQTFFDISSRSTIEQLIAELQTAPPQWIVYQRELNSLKAHEQIFNHGQRLPQHDLDDLIMQKIASGQWKLVDKQYYADWQVVDTTQTEDWYVIRTRQ